MTFSKRALATLVPFGVLLACYMAAPGWATQGTCIPASHPIARPYLQSLRQLVVRTDSVAVASRARYHLPADLDSAEVVAVTDPITCARAATLYFTDRDGSYTDSKPIFAVQMRTVYFVQEPKPHALAPGARLVIHSIVTDSAFSTIYAHLQSR